MMMSARYSPDDFGSPSDESIETTSIIGESYGLREKSNER
jgi:hypothetical protein